MLCCAHLFLAAITAGEEAVDAAGAATGAETRESTGVEGGEDSVAQGYSRIDQRRRRGGLRRGGRRGGEGKAGEGSGQEPGRRFFGGDVGFQERAKENRTTARGRALI